MFGEGPEPIGIAGREEDELKGPAARGDKDGGNSRCVNR